MRISGPTFSKYVSGHHVAGALAACLLLLCLCAPAAAQVTASASVEGTVKDIKEAVVPGATVTVTNVSTGLSRTAATGDEGTYRIDLLPAGLCEVKVGAGGCGDESANKVELLVGKTTSLDFTLSPGSRSETVTV